MAPSVYRDSFYHKTEIKSHVKMMRFDISWRCLVLEGIASKAQRLEGREGRAKASGTTVGPSDDGLRDRVWRHPEETRDCFRPMPTTIRKSPSV